MRSSFLASGHWVSVRRSLLTLCCLAIGQGIFADEQTAERLDRPSVSRSVSDSDLIAQIDQAIESGTKFLLDQQQADGTWRSKTYGLLKDGTSLTPLVLWAFSDSALTEQAKARGLSAVDRWIDHRSEPAQLTTMPQYPVYTAGLILQTRCRLNQNDSKAGEEIWRQLLIDHQLSARNGWSEHDSQFGGWGYSHEPPRKPNDDQSLSPLDEPNLSATLCALEGLSSAGPDHAALTQLRRDVLRFVEHCQNYRGLTPEPDEQFNDGGFYFLIGDDVRNKPGIAGTDSSGRTRYLSYGSATADGLRLLQLCGLDPHAPRRIAARRWLLQHLDDDHNPGNYPPARQHLRPALDFYYAASLTSALQREQADNQVPRTSDWSSVLAARLIKRQLPEGHWQNAAVDVREDDPLIATSFALRALQICRDLRSSIAIQDSGASR